MSEEEIIQHFEFIKSGIKEETKFIDISILECFEDLLDLYNKEKEKNKNKEKILGNIREEFNKYDWKNANPIQTYNQVKSLYESIFLKEMEK